MKTTTWVLIRTISVPLDRVAMLAALRGAVKVTLARGSVALKAAVKKKLASKDAMRKARRLTPEQQQTVERSLRARSL